MPLCGPVEREAGRGEADRACVLGSTARRRGTEPEPGRQRRCSGSGPEQPPRPQKEVVRRDLAAAAEVGAQFFSGGTGVSGALLMRGSSLCWAPENASVGSWNWRSSSRSDRGHCAPVPPRAAAWWRTPPSAGSDRPRPAPRRRCPPGPGPSGGGPPTHCRSSRRAAGRQVRRMGSGWRGPWCCSAGAAPTARPGRRTCRPAMCSPPAGSPSGRRSEAPPSPQPAAFAQSVPCPPFHHACAIDCALISSSMPIPVLFRSRALWGRSF